MPRLKFTLAVIFLVFIAHTGYSQNKDHAKNLVLHTRQTFINGQQATSTGFQTKSALV
ncbi:MAG: hypothetical protein ACE5NG_15770 [bacterium]